MKKYALITAFMAVCAIAYAGIESSPLFGQFAARKELAAERSGIELATLSHLQINGFPVNTIEEFQFFEETNEYLIRTRNNEICKGSLRNRILTGDCLNAAGLKTWKASGDSD
jgi:hypothetical protein